MENFKELSLAELMDKSVRLHINNFVPDAAFIFIYSIINMIIAVILALITVLPMISSMGYGSSLMYGDPLGGMSAFILPVFLISIVMYSLQFAQHIGFINVVKDDIYGRKVSLGRMIKSAYKNVFRVMSLVIAGSIMLSPIIIGMVVYFFSIASGKFSSTPPWSVIVIMIIAGILVTIFTTYHIYAVNVAFVEDIYFFEALKRSRELVKGKFLKTFGKITVMSILSSAIVSSLLSILGIIGALLAFAFEIGGATTETIMMMGQFMNLLRWPFQIASSFLVGPLFAFFISLSYYNERYIREGLDVELTCERLTAKMKFEKERELNV